MAEVTPLHAHGTNQHAETGGNDENVLMRGTSSRYRIAHLKRDRPDMAEALARGEVRLLRDKSAL
jgi:hypothetical protein